MEFNKTNYVILVTTIASFIVAYISVVPAVALPAMASYFELSNILQNWVINSFLFSVAIFAVPTGNLAGKWGIKKSFQIGSIIFLIGSVITPLAFSPIFLILFRVLQGFGAAMIYNTVMNLVTMAVPENERGHAIGIVVAGVYIGLGIAPVLGGILTYNLGWQCIFYFSIPFIVLYILLCYIKVKDEWKVGEGNKFDIKGALIWIVSIFLFVYGFTIINQSIGLIMAILGLIFLSIFVYVESKAKYPVYNVRVFKNKVFAFSNIASVVSYIATYFIIYILNYHLQYIKGWDPQITGLFLIITPVVQTIISPFSGRLSDRYNPQKLAAFGMLFVTIALFILVFLNKSTSLYVIALAMILQGLGYGIFSSPNTNIIMSSVKLEDTPVASVSVTVMRVVGQTMSLAMLTIIFAVIMGNVPIIPKYYHLLTSSCNLICIIGTILGIISIMACLVGIKDKTADIE